MGAFKSAVVTAKGQALLAKVITGTANFKFTSIKISENALGNDLVNITDIGTVKQVAENLSVIRHSDTEVKVSASLSNVKLSAGYYVRNIGLYAMDPEEGEILYSVSVADESTVMADWMPVFNGVGVSNIVIELITAVATTPDVNIEMDTTAGATVAQVLALQSQLDDMKTFVGYESADVYGVEIDFASKTINRVASAEHLTEGEDFDNLAPWGGRKRCIITDSGVRLAYYGEAGYTESGKLTQAITVNDTVYPVGTNAQVMVEQPIFYVRAVPLKTAPATSGRGNQYVKGIFYISPTPKVGFTAPRAFYDDLGVLQDRIYLSAYEGCLQTRNADMSDGGYVSNDSTSINSMNASYHRLSSVAGVKPVSGNTNVLDRSIARQVAKGRGTGWQLHNIFAMAVTQWLFMVEYASLDPQRKVGQGVCNLTDDNATNMAVVTGATASLGNGSGIPAGGVDGKCSVTYRGEENLWGNIWTWIDGLNIYAGGVNGVWIPKIGSAFIDNTPTGYECLKVNASYDYGFVSAFGIDERYPEILIPTEANGTDTFADFVYSEHTAEGYRASMFGGWWGNGTRCGFYLSLGMSSSTYTRKIGCRLLYVPHSFPLI